MKTDEKMLDGALGYIKDLMEESDLRGPGAALEYEKFILGILTEHKNGEYAHIDYVKKKLKEIEGDAEKGMNDLVTKTETLLDKIKIIIKKVVPTLIFGKRG